MTEHAGSSPDDELPSLTDREWAIRYAQYRVEELDRARESANKWQTALAGLSGLLMTGLALAAPFLASTIQDRGPRWSVTGGVVVTLILLGAAGWLATYAAAGLPKHVKGSGEFRDAVKKKVKHSVGALSWATGLYVVAQLTLVATVVTAIVLTPVTEPVLSSASVVLRDGRQLCGTVLRDSPAEKMRLALPDGGVEQFALLDVIAIQPVGSC